MCVTIYSKSINSLENHESRKKIEANLPSSDSETDKISCEKVFIADFLALTTYNTRKTFSKISSNFQKLKQSLSYK